MELLIPHVVAENAFDEVHLWVNTLDSEDVNFIHQVVDQHPKTFKAIPAPVPIDWILSLRHFWDLAADPDSVYVRLDDDIVWIEPGSCARFLAARLANPHPFLLFGNTVNNAICSHLHQRIGAMDTQQGIASYDCLSPIGWKSAAFAEHAHRTLIRHIERGSTAAYKLPSWIAYHYERISINACAWFRRDIVKGQCAKAADEEEWAACLRPAELQRPNEICGNTLFAHLAFFPQRQSMDETALLEAYRKLLPK
jgi:hypothetical protein